MLPISAPGTNPGIEYERTPTSLAAQVTHMSSENLPQNFPITLWEAQARRYLDYWGWFRGDYLSEQVGVTKEGKPIYRHPLGINAVRNISRKHAAVLLGEETFDSPKPPIKTLATPKLPLNGSKPTDEDKQLAQLFQNLVNEVWIGSKGRSLQRENAVLTQFLGGCVFQLRWEPRRLDLTIPITIRTIPADFFLPIWSDDPYILHEAYVVYRINGTVAKRQYGYDGTAETVIYVEHWTEKHFSIFINGEAITSDLGTGRMRMYEVPNKFGFVPFVYIPHVREGGFYGNSLVEDIRGLMVELNARKADIGDAIKDSTHRKRIGVNLTKTPREREILPGYKVIDIGQENPVYKNPPSIETEDPPQLSPGMAEFPDSLWTQLMREGNVSDISYGEDEGSQRSALTLAFRMYPSTSHARAERDFWNDGMIRMAWMIGRIIVIYSDYLIDKIKVKLPADFWDRLTAYVDWNPMVPRDREQMVNEIVWRVQAGLLSPRKALEDFGDIRNVDDELKEIREWLEYQASLGPKESPNNAPPQSGALVKD